MDSTESKDNKCVNPCPSLKRVDLKDDAHLKKYIMWENKSNICWLDASMALIAHNKVMKRYSGVSPECKISKIISAYDEAITILNCADKNINLKVHLARTKLNHIQESTMQYLQPILKYKTGDPDSAFCSLNSLLIQDSVMKQIFDVTWISVKECTNCGHHSSSKKSKPVITLYKVDSFDPQNPVVIYNCACNRSVQKMKLVYVSLPSCLIFHFESGAGKEKPPLRFDTQGREYQLTCIMTLEKSQDSTVNHFITWIRDPSVDEWLDCNDLNLDVISFTPDFPDIKFQDVHIYVYESFDSLGRITDNKIVETKKSDENIPCIDLSEESDNESSNSQNTASKCNKPTEKMETSVPSSKSLKDSNTSSLELDRDEPLKDSSLIDSVHSLDKKIQQNLKNTSDEINHAEILENQSEPMKMNNKKYINENTKTDNDTLRNTFNATYDVNMISTQNNVEKEMNKNFSKSVATEGFVKNDELNKENSCSFPSVGQTLEKISSITEDKSEAGIKVPSVVESKSLLHTEKEQNFQNKVVLSKGLFSCSNINDEKTLGSAKIKDLLLTKPRTKENFLKVEINNSELFVDSKPGINDEKLALDSDTEHQIDSEHISNAVTSSSGTSYVRLVRKKKYPSYLLNEKDCTRNPNSFKDLNSYEQFPLAINAASCSKSVNKSREKNQETNEDCDNFPCGLPKKQRQMEKISDAIKDVMIDEEKVCNSKAKMKVFKTGLKKSPDVESKLNSCSSKKRRQDDSSSSLNTSKEDKNPDNRQKLFSEQSCSQSETICDAGASNMNSDDHGKVLKEFEDTWSCHKPGCNCEFASLADTIDIVVDYTFAYLCKLSQEHKKSSSH